MMGFKLQQPPMPRREREKMERSLSANGEQQSQRRVGEGAFGLSLSSLGEGS